MLTALASLGSMAMSGLSTAGGWLGTAGGWLGTAGSWIGSNLGGIGSALGGIGGLAGSLFGSSKSSGDAKKMARLQYEYQQKAWKEGPTLQRQGLEKAGYNPMLALNGNSASFMPSVNYSPVPDIAGSAKGLAAIGKDILGMIDAQKDNIKADTKLKEGQLSAVETQRLLAEANASLLQSQTERSDLAYGRDIVDTITGIAGTGASLYSAKAMSDVAKANAAVNARNADTNARNATVNEKRLDSHSTETRYDKKGKPIGRIERSSFSHGVPTVEHTANPKFNASAEGLFGSSAKSAGSIAKALAKELLLESVVGVIGSGAGSLAADNLKRDLESGNYWDPKDRKNRKEKARKKWSLYHDIGF